MQRLLAVVALGLGLAIAADARAQNYGRAQEPVQYAPVPGALPPGLYRAGAIPAPPPAFSDPSLYYLAPTGWYACGGGYGSGYGGWGGGNGYATPHELRERARVPYQTALRDAQDYHYLNQIIGRDEALRRRNAEMSADALDHLRNGRYERAAVAALGASEVNQGDSGSRVVAGHALFALGRYADAVRLIRRAFELQPGLATSGYDIRDDFGRISEFNRARAVLERAAAEHPRSASAQTLLGYVRYYSSGPGSADAALRRAKQLDPGNELIDKLLVISSAVRSTAPSEPHQHRTTIMPTQARMLQARIPSDAP